MTTSKSLSPTIFTCNKHAEYISKRLKKFYEKEEFFDILLTAGSEMDSVTIKAHKIVILASSEYFRGMFHGDPSKASCNKVKLDKIEPKFLKPIVDFMYSGLTELNLESVEGLLRNAKILKMANLVNGCCEFIEKNLNSNNCLHWLRLAKELKLSKLEANSSIIVHMHLKEITKQKEFLLLDKNELVNVLFMERRLGGVEKQVMLGVLAWIEYERVGRQPLLHELLSIIRYQYLTPQFIIKQQASVRKSKSVDNYELILNWLQYHLLPESRRSLKSSTIEEGNDNGVEFTVISINRKDSHAILDYDRTLHSWALRKGSLPVSSNKSICGSSWITFNSKLYRVGGFIEGTKEVSNKVLCTNLKTLTTHYMPNMDLPRWGCKLTIFKKKLFVYGGFRDVDQKNFADAVEFFDLTTQQWCDLLVPYKLYPGAEIVHDGIEMYIKDFNHGFCLCYAPNDSAPWSRGEHKSDKDITDFRVLVVEKYEYAVCLGKEVRADNKNFRKVVVKKCLFDCIQWEAIGEFLINPCSRIRMASLHRNRIFFSTDEDNLIEFNIVTRKFKSRSITGLTDYGFYVVSPDIF